MTTDPNLPAVLRAAAVNVDGLVDEVAAIATGMIATQVLAQFGWSGRAHDVFRQRFDVLNHSLAPQGHVIDQLAATLRTAAANADHRISDDRRAAKLAQLAAAKKSRAAR